MGRRTTPIKKCKYCGMEIYRRCNGKVFPVHEPSSKIFCSSACYMQYRRETIPNNTKDRLYGVWRGMRERCSYAKHISAKFYQNRGITVCAEWENDFQAFKKWALENGYDYSKTRKEQSLDRIDNSKGYSPENCRWVSMRINNQNTRRTVNITFRGKTQCLSEWSRETGIHIETIRQKLKAGIPLDVIFADKQN